MKRRDFLKVSAAGLGTLALPVGAMAQIPEDPHFFLQVYVYGGIDSLFTFDGRPLAMTGAGLIHDYVKQEAEPWTGVNGGTCLATSMARGLERHRQRFSILNGVFSTTLFDGHLQNVNFLYTGNPFGGESFIPHLNDRTDPAYVKRALDGIQHGDFALDVNNGGNTIPLSSESAFKLIESLNKSRKMDPTNRISAYIDSRLNALSGGQGRFSAGSAAMSRGFKSAPDLAEKLKRLVIAQPQKEMSDDDFVQLLGGFFREGISSSALLQINPPRDGLDVHAARLARNQLEMYTGLLERVGKIFDSLAATPYDTKRSLLDVTTVMFASEFGRTLRQPALPVTDTGTDHNSLNNSILIGGKGIRGGQVIGATDWRIAGEILSGAHKKIDSAGIKLMGRPFDFNTTCPRQDKPEVFNLEDYLTIASVINTIYSMYSVPQNRWRTVKRDGPKAPVIKGLLA